MVCFIASLVQLAALTIYNYLVHTYKCHLGCVLSKETYTPFSANQFFSLGRQAISQETPGISITTTNYQVTKIVFGQRITYAD